MEFNVAKCKVMHTGNKNNEFSYEMNGKVLDKVLIEKDLGIDNSTARSPIWHDLALVFLRHI